MIFEQTMHWSNLQGTQVKVTGRQFQASGMLLFLYVICFGSLGPVVNISMIIY